MKFLHSSGFLVLGIVLGAISTVCLRQERNDRIADTLSALDLRMHNLESMPINIAALESVLRSELRSLQRPAVHSGMDTEAKSVDIANDAPHDVCEAPSERILGEVVSRYALCLAVAAAQEESFIGRRVVELVRDENLQVIDRIERNNDEEHIAAASTLKVAAEKLEGVKNIGDLVAWRSEHAKILATYVANDPIVK